MTTDEMVQSYLNAQDQTKQVQVLSELNACSKEDIVKVLQSSQRLKDKIVGGGVVKSLLNLTEWCSYYRMKSGTHIAYV